MGNTKASNMRLDQETEELINGLKKRLGGTKTSVVKQAVRELARKEEIDMSSSIQKPKREWMYNIVDLEDITATDLRAEAMKCEGEVQYVHIYLRGHAECAHALYLPDIQRMGIAWGADATWADVDDIEQGIEMWVNHPEEWISRN